MARKKNKTEATDWCEFPHCRRESTVIWLGVGLCTHHWNWVCDNPLPKAYKKLQIKTDKIQANEAPCNCVGGRKAKKGLEHFTEKEK